MTYLELQRVKELLMIKISGYATEAGEYGLWLKDERKLDPGVHKVTRVQEILEIYPHLKGLIDG